MKKILVILEGGKAFPSGITRGYIYQELFKRYGYKIKFVNRNSQFLLKAQIRPPYLLRILNPAWVAFLAAKINCLYTKIARKWIPLVARNYDIVYTSKVLDHELLYELKILLRKKLIYDFGDSVWLYKSNPRFYDIITFADAVITDNRFSLEHVKNYNPKCFIIPDYPQIELFDKLRNNINKNRKEIIIGWIGSQSTIYNLSMIWDDLHYLFTKYDNIHLRLVGTGTMTSIFPDFNYINYSVKYNYNQEEMILEALNMDIGLFPLQDIDASAVRGILKATVYMSAGIPVVCSPVGEINDFITNGINGFLASGSNEWRTIIEKLLNDKVLRENVGLNGLATVRSKFSLENNFKSLIQIINS